MLLVLEPLTPTRSHDVGDESDVHEHVFGRVLGATWSNGALSLLSVLK